MPCPDKDKDKLILLEIKRRKAMQEKHEAPVNQEIYWKGEITEVVFYVEDLKKIKLIEKMDSRTYRAIMDL